MFWHGRCSVVIKHISDIQDVVDDYLHWFVNIQPKESMTVFKEGLNTLGIFGKIKYSKLFHPLFSAMNTPIGVQTMVDSFKVEYSVRTLKRNAPCVVWLSRRFWLLQEFLEVAAGILPRSLCPKREA